MSSQSQMLISPWRALVLVPAGMNYFHKLHGHRLAEALRSLGLLVEVGNLSEQIEENYDWCVLTNISESLLSYGSASGATDANMTTERERLALAALRRLRHHCRAVACCSLDCANSTSYEEIQRRCQATGIDTILDFGFLDQSASLTSSARSLYHYIPNGLTSLEQEAVRREKSEEEERPIPWVFVDGATTHRVALVNHLITHVDPRGFVYIPHLNNVSATASQHLSQRQFEIVLQKSRYHIWCSHHQHFYLESERFHLSLLTGCVPIKVVSDDEDVPSPLPFDYLVLREAELAEKMRQYNFHEIRRCFRADFFAFPSLAEGLAKFLTSQSLLPGWEPSRAKPQAA